MIVEIILLALLANLMFGIVLYTKVRGLYKYPNLLGFPVVGNLYYFYKHLFLYSRDCSERYFSNVSEKYGMDVFFTFILGTPGLVLASPKHVEEIAHHPFASEKADCMYGAVRHAMYGPFSSVAPDDEWKIKRKEYNRALNRSLIDKVYHAVMTQRAKELAHGMKKDSKNADLLYLVFSNFMLTTEANFFRMDHDKIENDLPLTPGLLKKVQMAIHLGGAAMGNRIFGWLFRFVTQLFDFYQAVGAEAVKRLTEFRKCLQEQTSSYVSQDSILAPSEMPLGVAISMRRSNRRNNAIRDLTAELVEVIVTASHTTAMTLIGAIAFLATNPEIQERVWKEQNEIFGDSARDPTVEDLKQMTYLDRYVKETLRFTAPPSVMKKVTGGINLGGMIVPPGINILMLLHKIRQDPRYWPNPQAFDPDRFLNEDNIPRYAYAPFGVGIRSCPGKQYAVHQTKVAISTLIRRLKFSSNQKMEELEYNLTITVEMANLSPFQIEERK